MLLTPCANYKVAYNQDDILEIKSKIKSGTAALNDADLAIKGNGGDAVRIPFASIRTVTMYRHFGLAQMIKIEHAKGTIYVTVTRLNLFGYFISVNFLRTGELFKRLRSSALSAACEDLSQDSLEIEFQQMERDTEQKSDS